jgi:bleomycin hydrolase
MKLITMIGVAALMATTAAAQTALTPDVLKRLEQAQAETPADRALRNALAQTDINTLATSATRGALETDFTYRVPSRGITDQKSSGRCWLFTGLNVLRASAMNRLNLPELKLSQVYLFFYDQLEKSNLFLQAVIDTRRSALDDRTVDWLFDHPLSDGGTFTGVADLVMKYGVVPAEAMPETYSSEHTARIDQLLSLKLREFGLELRASSDKGATVKQLESRKQEQLETVYHILTLAYGVPPQQFSWKRRDPSGKVLETSTYTPREFYTALWGDDDLTANYVMLMNDPTRPYYKVYRIEYDRHTYDGHDWTYLNLPIDEVKPLAIASLKDSAAMYFSCDVGKYLHSASGSLSLDNYDYGALLGTTFGMNKEQRIRTHASASSHAMTLVVVDVDSTSQQSSRWMVENSWGSTSGWQGHLVMTDAWFNEYMFRVVVNRKYIDEKYLRMMDQKAVTLPAWDPMFMGEE